MRRSVTPELLDSDSGNPNEIAAALGDLRRISRWFGGVSTYAALIARVAAAQNQSQRHFSLLDVGSGPGDVAKSLQHSLSRNGISLAITLLDRSNLHLPTANTKTRAVAGDALGLPFRDASFDLIGCCTFAHHLEPEELIRFVNEALRVARVAVLINDLRRSAIHLGLVYAGFPLFRSRLTRHDGPASVRRAYTSNEMKSMLQQSAAARVEVAGHYLCRLGAIAWKKT